MKTVKIGPFSIEWEGFKRVLLHTALIGLASMVAYLYDYVKGHDFGQYTAIVIPVAGFVVTFLQRFLNSYHITVPVSKDTGNAPVVAITR